ncbi:MAG: hypothetical protein ACFFCZ_18655 [Promethearchaeota archaeon]
MSEEIPTFSNFFRLSDNETLVYSSLLVIGPQSKAELKLSTNIENIDEIVTSLIDSSLARRLESKDFDIIWPLPPFGKLQSLEDDIISQLSKEQNQNQLEFETLEKKTGEVWKAAFDTFSQKIDELLNKLDQEKDNSQTFAEEQRELVLKIENDKNLLSDRSKKRLEEETRSREASKEKLHTELQEISQEALSALETLKKRSQDLQSDVTSKFDTTYQKINTKTAESDQQIRTQIDDQFKSAVETLNEEFRSSASTLEKNAKELADSVNNYFFTSKASNLTRLEALRLELSEKLSQELLQELESNINALKAESVDKIAADLAEKKVFLTDLVSQIRESYKNRLNSFSENLSSLSEAVSQTIEDSKEEIKQLYADVPDQLQKFSQDLQENVTSHFQASIRVFETNIRELDEVTNKAILDFQKSIKGASETTIDKFVKEIKKLSTELSKINQEVQDHWNKLEGLKEALTKEFADFAMLLKTSITTLNGETLNVFQTNIKEMDDTIQNLSSQSQVLFTEAQSEGKDKVIENSKRTREEIKQHADSINSIIDTFREGLIRTSDDALKKWSRKITQFSKKADSNQTNLLDQIQRFSNSLITEFQEAAAPHKVEHSRLLLEIEGQVSTLVTESRKEIQNVLTNQKSDIEDGINQYAQGLEDVIDKTLDEIKATFEKLKVGIRDNTALSSTGISSVFEKHQKQFNDLFTRFSNQGNSILKNLKDNLDSSFEIQQELVENTTKSHSEALHTGLTGLLQSYRELQDKHFQDFQSNLDTFNKETVEKTEILNTASTSLADYVADSIKKSEDITIDAFSKLEQLEKDFRNNLDIADENLKKLQPTIQDRIEIIQEGFSEVTDSLVSKASNTLETSIASALDLLSTQQSDVQSKTQLVSDNLCENIKQIYEEASNNTENELTTRLETTKKDLEGTVTSFKTNSEKIQENVTESYSRLIKQLKDAQNQSKEKIEQFIDSFQDNSQTQTKKIQKTVKQEAQAYLEDQITRADEITSKSSEIFEQMTENLSEVLENTLTNQKAITSKLNEELETNFDLVAGELTETYDQILMKVADIPESFKTRSQHSQENSRKILENTASSSIRPLLNIIDEIPKTLEDLINPISEFLNSSSKSLEDDYTALEKEIRAKIIGETLRNVEDHYKKKLAALQQIQSKTETELLELFDSVADLSRSISSDIVSNYSTQILTAIEKVKSDAQESIIELRDELTSNQEENRRYLTTTQGKVQEQISNHINTSKTFAENFSKLEEIVSQLELLKFAETRLIRGEDIPKVVQSVIERSTERLTLILPILEPNNSLSEILSKVPTFVRIRLLVWFPPEKRKAIEPWLKELGDKIVNIKISKLNTEIRSLIVDRDGKELFIAVESGDIGIISSNENFVTVYEEYIAPIFSRTRLIGQ